MTDKRRQARISFQAEATFRLPTDESLAGRIMDISVGGAYFKLSEGLSAPVFGTEGVLVITAAGARGPLALPGTVRWAKAAGFGVHFGLLGAKETHALTQLSLTAKG